MASGSVRISQAAVSSCSESSRVHLMACEIDHDGEAPVSSYFDTSVREEGTTTGVQNGEKGWITHKLKLRLFRGKRTGVIDHLIL